jgi:hypothetical protein
VWRLAVRRGRAEAQRLSIRRASTLSKPNQIARRLCFIFIKRVRISDRFRQVFPNGAYTTLPTFLIRADFGVFDHPFILITVECYERLMN